MFDMSHLKRIGPMVGNLTLAAMAGFKVFDEAALADGAVALTTQSSYCIEVHGTHLFPA